jgi:hypothetical protein
MNIELSVLKEALQKSSPMEALEQIVKDLLGKGYSKENIIAEFEAFRKTSSDEDYEDVVLEVMDFLTGWCSPHKRIETSNKLLKTDDNELVSFIIHQLGVIEKAIQQFNQYLDKKRFNKVEQLLGNTKIVKQLNKKQLALLKQVLKNSQTVSRL